MKYLKIFSRVPAINWKGLAVNFFIGIIVIGCSTQPPEEEIPPERPPADRFRDAIPRIEPRSKYGNPRFYEVRGRRYYIQSDARGYNERGIASWYGPGFHGKRTSSGEPYNMYEMTAAHKTLPLPTYLYIKNLENGRHAILRVNDRGPFEKNRLLDLSFAGAHKLGVDKPGTALVEVQSLDPENPASWPSAATVLVAAAQSASDNTPNPAFQITSEDVPPTARTAFSPLEAKNPPTLYLQVGAFSSRENAVRLRQKLIDAGFTPGVITPITIDQQTLYRLRLGPLESVAAADNLLDPLERLGIYNPKVTID